MIKRLVGVLLALALLSGIAFRIRAAMTKNKILPTQEEDGVLHKDSSPRWISRTRVSVPASAFDAKHKSLNVGEGLILFQESATGQRCVFGLFRLVKVSPNSLMLDALTRRPVSRLQMWAEAHKIRLSWRWAQLKLQTSEWGPSQQCQNWIQHSAVSGEPVLNVSGHKFFIRGSQYIEVKAAHARQVVIESDHIRRGWWVRPQTGYHVVVLNLRNASTGFLEKLSLRFAKTTSASAHRKRKSKNPAPEKPFTLPGWQ